MQLAASASAAQPPAALPIPQVITVQGASIPDAPADDSDNAFDSRRAYPGSHSAVDAHQVETLGSSRIEDLAGLVPGLQADVASGGLSSAVKLRGFDISRLHFNGQPDLLRTFTRDLATVERMDILAGPAALFYGVTSPGGVVHYVGKQPVFTPQHVISLGVNADGIARVTADLGGPLGTTGAPAWAYRLVAAGQDGAAGPASLPQRRHTVMAALAWVYRPGARLQVEAETMQNNTPYGFGTVVVGSGPSAQVRYDQLYVSPGGEPAQRKMRRWSAQWQTGLPGGMNLIARYTQSGMQRQETLLGFWALESPTELSGYYTRYTDDYRQNNFSLRIEGQASLGRLTHHIAAGVDTHRQRTLFTGVQSIADFRLSVDQPDFSGIDGAALPLTDRYNHDQQSETAQWIADRIAIGPAVQLTAGLRRLHFQARADRTGSGLTTAMRGQGLTHHLGLTWQLAPGLQTHVTHNTGLQPNRGTTRDGSYLAPQRQKQWELGLRWAASPGLTLSGAVYRIALDGLPMTDPNDRTAVITSGRRAVQGLQASAAASLGPWVLESQVNALAMRHVVKTSARLGPAYPGVAKATGGFKATRPLKGDMPWPTTITLALSAVGPRYADAANTTRLPGYALAHTSATVAMGRGLTLSGGVRNLFDRRYVEAVTALDDVYQGARRQVWLQAEQRF